MLQVAPQRDGQAPCQGDDTYASHALAACREAPVEPQGQLTVGLQSQPAPRELDQQRPRSLVAGLADALLDLAAAAVVPPLLGALKLSSSGPHRPGIR